MRYNGVVKFYNTKKGWGFIVPADRPVGAAANDIFFHVSALQAAGINALAENEKVSFALEEDRKGRKCAIAIRKEAV